MGSVAKFQLTILDVDTILYKNEVTSIFVPGDHGEFEIMPFHYPVLTLLVPGNLVIDWKEAITINRGILKFLRNDCVVIVEIAD